MKKLIFLLCSAICLQAVEPAAVLNTQPIHEAFISRVTHPVPQEVVSKQPPAPLAETKPQAPNDRTIWIDGYWAWVREKKEFEWICGVWRLPPPDHTWSTGYWRQEKGGWTWVKGAWMPDATKTPWVYSKTAPPAGQNENTGAVPGPDYFWAQGYWNFSTAKGVYEWLSGSWQQYKKDFILEVAHWIWRPEGYLLVPTYWDWAVEHRGLAYDCKTKEPLSAQSIVTSLTCCFPDCAPTCNYYWHCCPQWWDGCGCVPVWWGWADWWALPWDDSWWLWWWWLNPDYPYPPFIPITIIDIFPPPPIVIIDIFDPLFPPIFITPWGIPLPQDWIDVLNGTPFLPIDDLIYIIDQLQNRLPEGGKKKPGGKPNGGHIPKPSDPHLTPPVGAAPIPPPPPPMDEHTKKPDDQGTHEAPIPGVPTDTPPPPPPPPPLPPPSEPGYIPPSQGPVYIPPHDSGGYWGGGGGYWWGSGGGRRHDGGGGRRHDGGGGRRHDGGSWSGGGRRHDGGGGRRHDGGSWSGGGRRHDGGGGRRHDGGGGRRHDGGGGRRQEGGGGGGGRSHH